MEFNSFLVLVIFDHIFLSQSENVFFIFFFQNIAVANATVEDEIETNEVQGFLFGKLK